MSFCFQNNHKKTEIGFTVTVFNVYLEIVDVRQEVADKAEGNNPLTDSAG